MQINLIRISGMVLGVLLFVPTLVAQQMQSERVKYEEVLALQNQMPEEDSEAYARLNKVIELDLQNASLEEAFDAIASQADLKLMYGKALLSGNKRVTYEGRTMSVYDALWDVLNGTGIQFAISQNRQLVLLPIRDVEPVKELEVQEAITGRVIDAETGESLPGVNLIVEGTETGTATDPDGFFELAVTSLDVTLVVSYVGYETQNISLDGQSELNLELQRQALLYGEELVVIGYGEVRRADLTGSVSNLSGRQIEDRHVSTLGEAFVGQLAGVRAHQTSGEPGKPLSITIRGVNSITAAIEPLYVIDGVPMEDMIDLNPSDIESIQILKDAASAAIYGSRGANGVVLISTKQGTRGSPTFSFNSSYGFQKVDGYYDLMNRDEWIAYTTWGRNFRYIMQGGSMSDPMSARPSGLQIPDSWWNDRESMPDTDWQRELYGGLSPQHNYNLSVSGGGDIGTFMVSAGYMYQDGIIVATDYERINIRANATFDVGENFQFGVSIAPSISTRTPGQGDGPFMAAAFSPIVPIDANTEETGYPTGVPYWNPIERYKQMHEEIKATRVLNNLWGSVELMESLSFTSRLGYNYREQNFEQFVPVNVNRGNPSFGNANVSRGSDLSLQNTLEYIPSISPLLDINLMLGQSFEEYNSFFISASARGYPNDLVHTLNVAGTKTGASTSEDLNRLSSYFSRVNLGVDDKYLLTATVRRDGSSKFGNDTKWGWFPSISAAWRIEQEEFMQNIDWMDLFKIRLMIGRSGNERIGSYEHISLLGSANYNFGGSFINGLAPSTLANPLLGWETKDSKGIGLDFSGFNNRVQVTVDYYIEDTKDMLLNVPSPMMTGFSSYRTNIGEVRNKGWEFDLTTHNISTGRFNWITGFNISRNANEVIRLGEDGTPILVGAGRAGTANTFITKVGEPIGSFYLWEADGILLPEDFDENGNPLVPILPGQTVGNEKLVDHTGDGRITEADKIVRGNFQPDFIFGLSNRFEYRNFDFNLLLNGQLGAEIFHISWRTWDSGTTGSFNQTRRWLNSYKADELLPEGEDPYPDTDVDLSWDGETRIGRGIMGPSPENTTNNLYDASYLRVKNLTIGYNMPSHISERVGLRNLRVYLRGDNLYTWHKFIGTSPEGHEGQNDGSSDSILAGGNENASYGIPRKYSVGLNFDF